MKSTYKLYGSYWDGRPIPESVPEVILKCDAQRKAIVALTELFKEEKNIVKDSAERCKCSGVLIDYIPMNDSLCVRDYYILRLLQAVRCNGACIVCDDEEKATIIKGWIESYYNRKTPQEQLAPSSSVFQMIC
ncbi:hypothetical protein [Butyrivibrio sp. INlla14]|uniref:hypothetical protein n=1 Tax=Butyrivibrio sp. INlla14 TaxID=1520808 RepID=UPI0008770B8D|nr:hypothetical protein [Butyrivibrio sp. INlla14]SCY14302.1 hypothetical protein SAMN02910371_01200 [Butyrivibrio sp. INlla14]